MQMRLNQESLCTDAPSLTKVAGFVHARLRISLADTFVEAVIHSDRPHQ